MLRSDIREICAEEEYVQRHREALTSLLYRRSKLLCESSEERMRRAQDNGEWRHLSPQECAELHNEEKRYLKSQIDHLQHEQARTSRRLAELRRLKARAKRIRAAEGAVGRKRH